jgi:hypothetical protein
MAQSKKSIPCAMRSTLETSLKTLNGSDIVYILIMQIKRKQGMACIFGTGQGTHDTVEVMRYDLAFSRILSTPISGPSTLFVCCV